MATPECKKVEDPARAARHCLDEIPYRMLVYSKANANNVPLYLVAGSEAAAAGAEKALRTAHKLHGGNCFYCRKPAVEITIDHVEPISRGGSKGLQNLVISCKACNNDKAHRPIDAYKPEAGREWLQALLAQVQDRLNRLQ